MSKSGPWEEVATGLARMARDLMAQHSTQDVLDRVAAYAETLVDGCEAAGVLVVRGGRVQTVAATDQVVRASDRLQDEVREGPCFDAADRKEEVYRIADLTACEQWWPRYAPRAREIGIGSMMGFLLFTDGEDDLGVLNLYSVTPGAFTETSEQVGWLLASHAAVALSTARHNSQLREAISTRQDIGEALGILMERHNIDEDTAFALLVRTSQDHNIKIRDLVRTISTTGEIPPRPQ